MKPGFKRFIWKLKKNLPPPLRGYSLNGKELSIRCCKQHPAYHHFLQFNLRRMTRMKRVLSTKTSFFQYIVRRPLFLSLPLSSPLLDPAGARLVTGRRDCTVQLWDFLHSSNSSSFGKLFTIS